MRSSQLSPAGSKRTTSPTPSTCPLTRCPPRRSASRSAFSRLTSPLPSSPTVQRIDSSETSTLKLPLSSATAVRQQPLTAILSPTATSARSSPPASMTSRRPPARGSLRAIFPIAATIPVNIPILLLLLRYFRTRHRLHGGQHDYTGFLHLRRIADAEIGAPLRGDLQR